MTDRRVAAIQGDKRQPTLSATFWFTLLVAAATLRILFVFVLLGDMGLQSDAPNYSKGAQDVLANFPGSRRYYYPPGMLFYLAAAYGVFGHDLAVSRLATIALDLATTVMVVVVARQAFDIRVAMTAGWIAAVYPPAVLMSGQTLPYQLAGLALLCLVWSIQFFARRPNAISGVVAGAALAIGVLTRPSMLSVLLGVTVAAAWWTWRALRVGDREGVRSMAGACAYLYICVLLATLPVMAHNASHGEGWSISTNNERNLFLGNNPYTHFYKTHHLASRGGQRASPQRLDPEVVGYLTRYVHAENARAAMRNAAVTYMIDHPWTTIWRTLSRMRAFWGFDYVMSRQIQEHFGGNKIVLLIFLIPEAGGYLVVMLAVISGLIIASRSGLMGACLPLLIVTLLYQLPYCLAYSAGIYHFPVMGLLFPIAALNVRRSLQEIPPLVGGERRWFWLGATGLLLLQLEYAYHAASLSELR
jgi:4-amino-4-deoxy-L-arabinose transferase-like glycosyltransferase